MDQEIFAAHCLMAMSHNKSTKIAPAPAPSPVQTNAPLDLSLKQPTKIGNPTNTQWENLPTNFSVKDRYIEF